MFNWVCPRCGKDVPPSKTECPFCPELPVAEPPPVQPHYAAQAVQPQYAPQAVQPQYAPQAVQPQYAPPPPGWPPPQRQGAPAWLIGVAFGLAVAGVFAALYMYLDRQSSAPATAPAQTASAAPAAVNPLQKYVEVTGFRLVTENKQQMIRFVVINHSGAEMADVNGKVTLVAGPSRTESVPVGTFRFAAKSLGAHGSAELRAPFDTKMKAYELPDWQTTMATVEITSPAP